MRSAVPARVSVLDRAAQWHPALIVAGTVGATLVTNLLIWLAGLAGDGSFQHTEAGVIASTLALALMHIVISLAVLLGLATVRKRFS